MMWNKAALRLTIQYSAFFLICIGLFSAGLYKLVDLSFDDNYINEVENRLVHEDRPQSPPPQQRQAVETAAEVAVSQFRMVIIFVDLGAVILIPIGSYIIARRTLRPLIESNERQKRFVANASHELRTPLAILSGELDLALKRDRDKQFYKQTIIASKQEVERLTSLSDQLLQLHRVETQSQGGKLPIEKIAVRELFTTVVTHYQAKARTTHHEIKRELSDKNMQINVNVALFQTALNNLVENALKYSKPDTSVIIRATQNTKKTVIEVESIPNNPLDQDELNHIFERFYQTKDETHKQGFGLGLPIALSILEAHGGTIKARLADDSLCFSISLE